MPKYKRIKKQWVYIGLILILFIMILGVNSRLSEYLRLSSQKEEMDVRIEELQSTRGALETQIAYSNSDKAVEEWARTYERFVYPGDKVIIPLPPEESSQEFNYLATATPESMENWQVWWEMFFK